MCLEILHCDLYEDFPKLRAKPKMSRQRFLFNFGPSYIE